MAIRRHQDLEVYQLAFAMAMQIFKESQRFPKEERYFLTDQIRRSSRSVCANLADAWRKRRYKAAFVAKLSDSEAEAAETQNYPQPFSLADLKLLPSPAPPLPCWHHVRILGSIKSRNPSPSRLKQNTASINTAPGNRAIHHSPDTM
jgi:four helix bundle protein